jgi:hypothetical protein
MADSLKVFVHSGGKTSGHVFPIEEGSFEITMAYKGVQEPPPPPALIQDVQEPPPPPLAPVD